MNRRERAVLLFLAAAFAVGAAVAGVRELRRARRAETFVLSVDSSALVIDTTPAGPLDLNAATAAGLEALPGIGPVIAGRILDYRGRHGRFRSVGELRQVSGIGPKRYAALRELVFVGNDSL